MSATLRIAPLSNILCAARSSLVSNKSISMTSAYASLRYSHLSELPGESRRIQERPQVESCGVAKRTRSCVVRNVARDSYRESLTIVIRTIRFLVRGYMFSSDTTGGCPKGSLQHGMKESKLSSYAGFVHIQRRTA